MQVRWFQVWWFELCLGRARESASYWDWRSGVHIAGLLIVVALLCACPGLDPAVAADDPVRIVALGDSLTAGLGLPANDAFPAKLQAALRAKGISVDIANAGVSGDTASRGLARLDWSVPEGTDAVIVELGANDMLLGFDPKITRKALTQIVHRLRARHIPILLAGMRAAPNLGAQFGHEFESIYSDLGAEEGVLIYPFFLDGVAVQSKLNQRDGVHPTAEGVDHIVAGILPKVEELIARARQIKQ
jgi:acyl-CoA thioesterase-1